jgi:hypothetical protein
MTINELIEMLEALRDDGFGEVKIEGAMQPSYPLEAAIMINAHDDDGEDGKRVTITAEACGGYASKRDFEGEWLSECITG